MEESLWESDEQLNLVLYEKTLFFVGALLDPKVQKNSLIKEMKMPILKKVAKVLLLGSFDQDDIRYKVCFATLLRES